LPKEIKLKLEQIYFFVFFQTETEEEDDEVDSKKKGKKKSTSANVAAAAAASASRDVTKSGKKRGKKDATPVVEEKKKKKVTKLSETPMAAIAASLLPVPQEVLDMPVDPNEPTYCLCQQVSYGEMIGCDNPDCPIEWFHFGCMSLVAKPKGKWYCPKCLPSFKKKK
jgi:inhibitor of growth protein 4